MCWEWITSDPLNTDNVVFEVRVVITATQPCQCLAGFGASHGSEAWSLGLNWGGREEEEERRKPLNDFWSCVANRLLF